METVPETTTRAIADLVNERGRQDRTWNQSLISSEERGDRLTESVALLDLEPSYNDLIEVAAEALAWAETLL